MNHSGPRRTRRWRLAVSLLSIAVLASIPAASAASQDSGTSFDSEVQDVPASQSDPFAMIQAYEEEAATDPAFGGLWIETRPTGIRVNVGVKGALRADPKSYLDHPDVEVQVVAVENSSQELQAEFDRMMLLGSESFLDEKGGEHWPFAIYTDVMANRVVLEPNLNYPGATELIDSWHLDDRLVRVDLGAVSADAAYRGGQRVSNNVGQFCTAGFNVQNSSGAKGTLTAGHCPSTNMKQHGAGPAGSSVSLGNAIHSTNYWDKDRQIHPHTISITTPSALINGQPINGWGNSYPNETVCKYGTRTAQTLCGSVIATNYDPDGAGSGFCACFVRANMVALGGDSGGPDYRVIPGTGSGYALGITKGCITNYQIDNPCQNWPASGFFNHTYYTNISKAVVGTGYQVISGS